MTGNLPTPEPVPSEDVPGLFAPSEAAEPTLAGVAAQVRYALEAIDHHRAALELSLDNIEAALADGERWIASDNAHRAAQQALKMLGATAAAQVAAERLPDLGLRRAVVTDGA